MSILEKAGRAWDRAAAISEKFGQGKMMTDFDNTNRGVLFKNDKEGNEARPDYTGKIDFNGKEMRLAAWIKESKDGTKKFLSLNVSEFPTKQVKNTCTLTEAEPLFEDDGGIPF